MNKDLAWLGERLGLDGAFVSAIAYGSGHINDTYAATYRVEGTATGRRRFIHQRINDDVFRDPEALMRNTTRVTRHLHAKLDEAGAPEPERRALTLVAGRDGENFVVDDDGKYWRTFPFIEGASTYDVVETAAQAREVGRAFGEFQGQLIDLGPPPLEFTIPDFHNSPKRLDDFRAAVERDACGRAATVRAEIEAVERHAGLAGRLLALRDEGAIPTRVVHNDTKINNVLIDDATGEGLCVIDLDTVMPGLAADDFGDLVRTSSCFAREDDRDLAKVVVDLEIFEALAAGYLAAAAGFLEPAEIDSLLLGGKLMTYEMALRFLGDHLSGDSYFRIHREGHNLDRARVQIALLDSLIAHEDRMRAIIEEQTTRGCP